MAVIIDWECKVVDEMVQDLFSVHSKPYFVLFSTAWSQDLKFIFSSYVWDKKGQW